MSTRDDILAGLRQLDDSQPGDMTPEELLNAYRAEVLREEADDVVLFCPDHSDHYSSYLSCHCPVADVLRQRADKAASSGSSAGDEQPETDLAAERDRLKAELDHLHRITLPDLRRETEWHRAGKKRWRDRAMSAEPRLDAVLDICDREQRNAMRWENPTPVPEWVAVVQRAALGDSAKETK